MNRRTFLKRAWLIGAAAFVAPKVLFAKPLPPASDFGLARVKKEGQTFWVDFKAKTKGTGTAKHPFKDINDALDRCEASRRDVVIVCPHEEAPGRSIFGQPGT